MPNPKIQQDLTIELKFETTQWKKQTTEASDKLDELNQRFKTTANSTEKARKSTLGLGKALGYIASFQTAKYMTTTALALDRVANRMKFATASSADFAKAMELSSNVANQLGLALIPTQRGLATLQASAKGSALAGKEIEELFKGISQASGALSLTADETNSVFLAFSQIISKGKVQAEELRSQIGERIPGAMLLAQKALGVTGAELDKLLQSGSLMADDLLPKLAREFQNTFSDQAEKNANSLTAQINKISNGLKAVASTTIKATNELLPFVDVLSEISARYNDIATINSSNDLRLTENLSKLKEDAKDVNREFAKGNITLEQRTKQINDLIRIAKNVGESESELSLFKIFGIDDGSATIEDVIKTNQVIRELILTGNESKSSIDSQIESNIEYVKTLERIRKNSKEIAKIREQERAEFKAKIELDLGIKKSKELKKELELRLRLKKAQGDALSEYDRQRKKDPNSPENLKKKRDLLKEELKILRSRQSLKEANEVNLIQNVASGSNRDVKLNIEARTRELGATAGSVDVAKQQLITQERMERQLEELNKKIEKVGS